MTKAYSNFDRWANNDYIGWRTIVVVIVW